MKYFSTQRPLAPGTFPKVNGSSVYDVVNFGNKVYCPEIGREAWGYVEYSFPILEELASSYELIPGKRVESYAQSEVIALDEKTGVISTVAVFALPAKAALVAFIQQMNGNYNTWDYPKVPKGMRESPTAADHWYFDDISRCRVLSSHPV